MSAPQEVTSNHEIENFGGFVGGKPDCSGLRNEREMSKRRQQAWTRRGEAWVRGGSESISPLKGHLHSWGKLVKGMKESGGPLSVQGRQAETRQGPNTLRAAKSLNENPLCLPPAYSKSCLLSPLRD